MSNYKMEERSDLIIQRWTLMNLHEVFFNHIGHRGPQRNTIILSVLTLCSLCPLW